jgi:hypothetical protein
MLILKHLKTLQHVSIIIQIIIREFVGSLLNLLNLKFNCQWLNVVMRQHNIWCKCVTFCVVRYVGLVYYHWVGGGGRTYELPDDDQNMLGCF